MDLKLKRGIFREDGIFGSIYDSKDNLLFTTCEHSYDFMPKLPKGTYTCKRGIHRLKNLVEFEDCKLAVLVRKKAEMDNGFHPNHGR